MKRKLALVLSVTMIMTSALTGCTKNSGDDSSSSSSSKGGQYKSAKELINAYTKEDHDNSKMDMNLSVNVVMSSDGTEFEMPITLKGDMEIAKDAGHGNMEMSMEMMGEAEDMSYELYTVKDGENIVVYSCDKETEEWIKSSSEGASMDASALNEILENDVFKDADLSYKNNEYTMTVPISNLLENEYIKDKMSNLSGSASSLGFDEDMIKEIIESVGKSDIVYVFDDDLNMTKVSIKDMEFETSTEEEHSMDLEIKLDLNIKYSDFGKIDEEDVKVPDEVVDEAEESGSDSFDDIFGDEDDMDTDDDFDDEEDDDDSDSIVDDNVDRSDFKAGEDVLGSLDGKALTSDSKWDDTFGKAGFEFDSDVKGDTICASSDDYEGVSLTVRFYNVDDEKDVEDFKNDGMESYVIDASSAENKPEMTWNGLTWGASAEDIVKAYGEPDDKYEGPVYDSYTYEYGDYSTIEFDVYYSDSQDTGLQTVAVVF